jgi:hypothetical protein
MVFLIIDFSQPVFIQYSHADSIIMDPRRHDMKIFILLTVLLFQMACYRPMHIDEPTASEKAIFEAWASKQTKDSIGDTVSAFLQKDIASNDCMSYLLGYTTSRVPSYSRRFSTNDLTTIQGYKQPHS